MAITFDASSMASTSAWLSGTPQSWSHTCGGSNKYLLVYTMNATGGTSVSSVTYNGVAMTKLYNDAGHGFYNSIWGLTNPASGTNTVTVNFSSGSTGNLWCGAASYNGVDQVASFGSATNANSNATSLAITISKSINQWFVGATLYSSSASSDTITNSIKRGSNNTTQGGQVWDSNGDTTNGSYSLTASGSSSDREMIGILLNPFTPGTLGEYIGAGSGTTKLLMHLNGSSADSSGNSNNGSDTAITYSQANGKFGQGAGFNGTTSNITTPDNTLGIGSAFTFSAWIKTSAITEQGIYCRDTVGVLRAWQFRVDATTGVLRLKRFDSGGGLQTNFATSTAVNTGNYTHVVATWNTTVGTVLYINGKNSGTDSNVTAQNNNTGVTPKIGIGTGAAAIGPFNGAIDEVIVENVVWSATKVQKYYSMTKGRYATL